MTAIRTGNEKELEQNKPSRAETSGLKRCTLDVSAPVRLRIPIGPDLTALEYILRLAAPSVLLAPLLKNTAAETGREGWLGHLARI